MPLPEDVHRPVVVPPVTVPARLVVPALEQIVCAGPVITTATLRTVTTAVAATAPHGDWLPVEVSVSVTVPVEASAADGV